MKNNVAQFFVAVHNINDKFPYNNTAYKIY